MGAMTDALTAVESILTALGIATVIKEFSNVTPPTTTHCVLSCEASSLDRAEVDGYTGTLTVTVDWFKPGNESDGQAEYLAAMDDWDAIVVALTQNLDRTCQSIDPGGNIVRQEESADLAHWYAATATVAFMRQEGIDGT
jgi:hypothetical protein